MQLLIRSIASWQYVITRNKKIELWLNCCYTNYIIDRILNSNRVEYIDLFYTSLFNSRRLQYDINKKKTLITLIVHLTQKF